MATHHLSRTITRGTIKAIPKKKLRIFATRMSQPPRMNAPPKREEPMYPAASIIVGLPPSTRVQPPRIGSMVTAVTVPPVRIAWR